MNIITFNSDIGYCNSYLLTENGREAVMIDCASSDLLKKAYGLGMQVKTVLLTHGHFDHVSGCGVFAEDYASFYCSEKEKPLIFSEKYLGLFGGVRVNRFEINRELKDGERFELWGMKFTAIHTPGHTAGSMCYVCGDSIFTGDTLFCGSVGRWDLPTGNLAQLKNSLNKIKNLQGDYKLYCGHGETSTLEHERKFNDYLK